MARPGAGEDGPGPPNWLGRRLLGFPREPEGETYDERLVRARAWQSSESPKRRRRALPILAAHDPVGAVELLLGSLKDPDRRVRMAAAVSLMMDDAPDRLSDHIVQTLGGEAATADWFVVKLRAAPGIIGTLGLTDRLLPHLKEIAQRGERRRDRRRAAQYVRILESHTAGWPRTG